MTFICTVTRCQAGFALILLGALAATPCEAATAASYASRICIERPGENGRVNIAPVTIRVHELAELTILGEEEVCLGINADGDIKSSVSLKFSYPYGGPSEDTLWWESPPIAVSIKAGKTTRLLLCERNQTRSEAWAKSGWQDMWMLLPLEKRSLCAQ